MIYLVYQMIYLVYHMIFLVYQTIYLVYQISKFDILGISFMEYNCHIFYEILGISIEIPSISMFECRNT